LRRGAPIADGILLALGRRDADAVLLQHGVHRWNLTSRVAVAAGAGDAACAAPPTPVLRLLSSLLLLFFLLILVLADLVADDTADGSSADGTKDAAADSVTDYRSRTSTDGRAFLGTRP